MKWVGWVCAVLIGCAGTTSAEPTPASSPQPAVAVVGDDYTFLCPLKPPLNAAELARVVSVEWTCKDKIILIVREGKPLPKETNKEYKTRTAWSEQGLSLKLFDVKHNDTNTYRCFILLNENKIERIGEKRRKTKIREASVSLNVGELPEPFLFVRRHEDGRLFLHCESSGWALEPQASWLDSRGHAHQATSSETTKQPDGFLSITQSLHIDGDDETFICRVQSPKRMKEIKMHVTDLYVPSQGAALCPQGPSIACISGWVVVVIICALCFCLWQKLKGHISRCLPPWCSGLVAQSDSSSQEQKSDLSSSSDPAVHSSREEIKILMDEGSEGTAETENLDRRDDSQYTEYGDIMEVETIGAFEITAKANKLESRGVQASEELAKRDLDEMEKFKDIILNVGKRYNIHPALIAAIISKQSRFGELLEPNGYGKTDHDCFGLMQVNKAYHPVKGTAYSEEHVDEGTLILVQGIKGLSKKHENLALTKEMKLKGGIAAYMAGVEGVCYDELDTDPRYGDFANDVVARAQWFARNGNFD